MRPMWLSCRSSTLVLVSVLTYGCNAMPSAPVVADAIHCPPVLPVTEDLCPAEWPRLDQFPSWEELHAGYERERLNYTGCRAILDTIIDEWNLCLRNR